MGTRKKKMKLAREVERKMSSLTSAGSNRVHLDVVTSGQQQLDHLFITFSHRLMQTRLVNSGALQRDAENER